MSIFSRKKDTYVPDTGFVQFVKNDRRYHFAADYITNRNEIDEDLAFEHMAVDGYQIGDYTMPKFKKLVARLYAQYLEAQDEISSEDLQVLQYINATPINVTIRRIKAKASGNNWSVQYLGRTVYYGKTLNEAYKKLIDRNPKLAAKFQGPEA